MDSLRAIFARKGQAASPPRPEARFMALLSRLIFADEFVVDEKPEPEFFGGDSAKHKHEVQAAIAESEEEHEGSPADMLSALSAMLERQERLKELNEALRESQGKGADRDLDGFIKRFLARLDGFDRILDAFRAMPPTEEVNNWLKSLEGLYYKMQMDMERIGLSPIETLGREVDLDCMEVIDYRPTREYPHNTVMHELKKGYRYKGKILRDAQVVVARNERG